MGYDASTMEWVDLVKAGIIDPAKVTRSGRCRTQLPSRPSC